MRFTLATADGQVRFPRGVFFLFASALAMVLIAASRLSAFGRELAQDAKPIPQAGVTLLTASTRLEFTSPAQGLLLRRLVDNGKRPFERPTEGGGFSPTAAPWSLAPASTTNLPTTQRSAAMSSRFARREFLKKSVGAAALAAGASAVGLPSVLAERAPNSNWSL